MKEFQWKWTLVISLYCLIMVITNTGFSDALTAQDVIALIQKNVHCEWSLNTVDTFKIGDPSTTVTGIVTTFTASQDVLQKAVDAKCNLIIAHEPAFYNHMDDVTPLQGDPVQEKKKKFIEDHGLVLMRFHDHIHKMKPDGILVGMIDKLGWKSYQTKDDPDVFELPKTTLRDLPQKLKTTFAANTIRVIGNPDLETTKIGFSPGADSSLNQIGTLQRDDVEVLIIGETREWETVEYVRDASIQGKRKALIILGHNLSEEYGMKYCAEWLKTFIKDIPIQFIPAGSPYWAP